MELKDIYVRNAGMVNIVDVGTFHAEVDLGLMLK
jgi:hypothetical protein